MQRQFFSLSKKASRSEVRKRVTGAAVGFKSLPVENMFLDKLQERRDAPLLCFSI